MRQNLWNPSRGIVAAKKKKINTIDLLSLPNEYF